MPVITTTTLPAGIVGGAYSQAIVATKNNLDVQVSRAGPGILADGSGIDDQGNVDWDDTLVLTYTVTNIGDDDLDSLSAAIGSSTSTVNASITAQPATTLEPLATTTFEVTIDLLSGAEWTVVVELSSDADAPKDSYTFDVDGDTVDCLFGVPILPVFTIEPTAFCFAEGFIETIEPERDVCFVDGFVMGGADVEALVANSEWAIDLGRGTTAVYQTSDSTTAAASDGDDIYSIYPEKTPTGSTAIKLLDSNASTHGLYKDAAGYNIGGSPVLSLANGTDGLYYPVNVSDVQQTDNSNYISTGKYWCAWLIRVRPGTDSTPRKGIRGDGVPRLWIEYTQQNGSNTDFSLVADATPTDNGVNVSLTRDGTNGNLFWGALYWDGTDTHWWGNSIIRTDTLGGTLDLQALNSTSPLIFGLEGAYPLDIQAWYQGDQDGGNIAQHISQLQELVENFAAR